MQARPPLDSSLELAPLNSSPGRGIHDCLALIRLPCYTGPVSSLSASALSCLVAALDPTHAALTEVLRAHVADGWVHYGALGRDPGGLDRYLGQLAETSAADLGDPRGDRAKAFWINAYNALALQLVRDRRPSTSIREVDGAFDRISFRVAGRQLTLDAIEHQILRPAFSDPRIHAVLVCAARGCPPLEARAFTEQGLDARLEAAARRFARDPTRNRWDPGRNVLRVSRIFEWFGADFVARHGGGTGDEAAAVRAFFSHHLGVPIPTSVTIEYLEYDWRLNGSW